MTFNLDNAIVYDIETFPNCITFHMQCLNSDYSGTWEISQYRDERNLLMQFFRHLSQTQTAMIGFNNLNFDYPIMHLLFNNPQATYQDMYRKAMDIIESNDRFGNMIWADKRFAPQIDLFKIYHMDNPAKSTSLKALQINMRSETVVDMPIPLGTFLTEEQIEKLLIPYNVHDVTKTKQFTKNSLEAINFRISLIEKFGIDVLNWPDTKIGSRIMESKLGDELCYDRTSGKRVTRQTFRNEINLGDIIFPYIQFENPEFKRVHEYLRNQTLRSQEINLFGDDKPKIKTKGVFTELKAHVGNLDFHFGTGGIHGSALSQKVYAEGDWIIKDIDVASLYPSIAIVNKLSPAHLGESFVEVYASLPQERKKWQKEKGKKCVEANTLKLASNGVYGNSNNPYSVFYDPQFTLSITVNGQLMLCMLAERLIQIPTLKIIQINTDGITYFINKKYQPLAKDVCQKWEAFTCLTLEEADYTRMWIRDVNNYVAESSDGSLKIKGAYWNPDPLNYEKSISDSQPPAWHKDLSNPVSIRAAISAMVHNIPPEQFIGMCYNPYDFMCRAKVGRSDTLMHGDTSIQRTSRYYVSKTGAELIKHSPPVGIPGRFKRKNGVTETQYQNIMTETNWEWDDRVCTKNMSRYENRSTTIAAGHKTAICNDYRDFNFSNIDYNWYISEANKLIIQ